MNASLLQPNNKPVVGKALSSKSWSWPINLWSWLGLALFAVSSRILLALQAALMAERKSTLLMGPSGFTVEEVCSIGPCRASMLFLTAAGIKSYQSHCYCCKLISASCSLMHVCDLLDIHWRSGRPCRSLLVRWLIWHYADWHESRDLGIAGYCWSWSSQCRALVELTSRDIPWSPNRAR